MLATDPVRRQARSLRFRVLPWPPDHPDWLYLDSRLAADHPARLVAHLLDLFDFQPLLADFYAGFGSASYHPRVYLAVILFELDQGRCSPAQWARDCTDSLPLLWLLGGACPSRASLYQCRNRFRPALLEQLNGQLLELAAREGHRAGKAGSLDGTFVAARGSRHQMLNLKRLDKRLALLEHVLDDELRQRPVAGPAWMAKRHQGRLKQRDRHLEARRQLLAKIERHRRRQSRRAKKKRQGEEQVRISVSEPQAVIGKDKTKVVRPLYDVQLLRELDSGLLLGYGVFPTNTDAGLLPEMLKRTRRLSGTLPGELLADGIYASVADLRVCAEQGIVLYAPLEKDKPAPGSDGRVPLPVRSSREEPASPSGAAQASQAGRGYYPKSQFTWDEGTGSYTCPAGQRLRRVSRGKEKRGEQDEVAVEIYGGAAFALCPRKAACTSSKRGRRIKRMVEEPLVEELRQRMNTDAGKAKYKKRMETSEWPFADFKEHRGLRRFSSFTRPRAETTIGLLVLLHNAKTLLRARQAAHPAA